MHYKWILIGIWVLMSFPFFTKAEEMSNDDMVAAVRDNYILEVGEGNDSENHQRAQNFMQEVLRDSVSKIYAFAFTTRTQLAKEKPRDVDMSNTGQMIDEANAKAIDMINRLAKIYVLESLWQTHQYTQALKTLTVDKTKEGAEEKKDEQASEK